MAFEPNPLVIPELRARCGHRKNWTVVEAALGSGAAIATLYARQPQGQSGFLPESGGTVVATYNVPMVTLDSAIQSFRAAFFWKIDVEGWELEVLRGLTQPLPLVSFEFHVNGRDVPKTIACLERLGHLRGCRVNLMERTLPGDKYGEIFVRSDEQLATLHMPNRQLRQRWAVSHQSLRASQRRIARNPGDVDVIDLEEVVSALYGAFCPAPDRIPPSPIETRLAGTMLVDWAAPQDVIVRGYQPPVPPQAELPIRHPYVVQRHRVLQVVPGAKREDTVGVDVLFHAAVRHTLAAYSNPRRRDSARDAGWIPRNEKDLVGHSR